MIRRGLAAILAAILISGCAGHRQHAAIIAEPPPTAAPPVTPVQPADAAMIWQLRVALNVAALVCRGHGSSDLVSGYNAMLRHRSGQLASAQAALAARYGGVNSHAYDSAMVRLYNFYARPTATAAFCPVAVHIQHDERDIAVARFADFAVQSLAELNAPFAESRSAKTAQLRSRTAH